LKRTWIKPEDKKKNKFDSAKSKKSVKMSIEYQNTKYTRSK